MSSYLVTGGAGFIGSYLVAALCNRGDKVCVIDDLSTGHARNIESCDKDIRLFHGSILDRELLTEAMRGVDVCFHEAAIPSVPRSVDDPIRSDRANVEGSLAVYLAARDAGVRRVVTASSSSVYGPAAIPPVKESYAVAPASPYAVSKAAAEMYARVCNDLFQMDIVCIRYFNVFGPGQDPNSPYAAVVPRFITALLDGNAPEIHGDGGQSRDFTYIDNVVRANLLAADHPQRLADIFNVACGSATSVMELFQLIRHRLGSTLEPTLCASRPGDIRHSMADCTRAAVFGYAPQISIKEGIERTVQWYEEQQSR